jgi:hypothetical protein
MLYSLVEHKTIRKKDMFDTTVELVGASVGTVDTEPGKEGVLELVFISGLTFPIQGPDGNPLRVPSGQYKFQLTRSQAIEFFDKVKDAASELPEGSNIVVPTSSEDVEKVAKTIEEIKKNG